jgi:hypothetical protein
MDQPYSILLWQSHPNQENDDCCTGVDFSSKEEAERIFASENPIEELSKHTKEPARFRSYYSDIPFIELDGTALPGEDNPVRQLCAPKSHRDDEEWTREFAMQQGMAFGCEGYNEAMGWD